MARPSIMTRLMAAFQEEVSASDLEAFKVAGTPAFALLDTVAKGYDPRTASQQERIQVFCRWIAFALLSAGDSMLEADYEADPLTIGYVPEVTRRQTLAFYEEASDWSGYGKEAEASAYFQLPAGLQLPVAWPEWVEVEPCPEPHLAAMVQMAEKLGSRVRILHTTDGVTPTDKLDKANSYVKQLLARGDHKRERASVLWRQKGASQARHEGMEEDVKTAIAAYFLAGQIMAMPELIARIDQRERTSVRSDLSMPGSQGFDPWCLTDPATRNEWKRDRTARLAIESLWANDPDPSSTLRIQSEIDAALERGDIARQALGNYFCCPWSAIYRVVNPISIDGRRLRRNKEFTFDVSAEEMAEGGDFKREILVANFSPTNKVDYCIPGQGDHDDD